MTGANGAAPLPKQVQEALPAEPDALAIISGQIATIAIERANSIHQKQTETLKAALSEREAHATQLQARCDELLSDHVTLSEDLASAHETIARLEGEKSALASSVRTLAERVQKLEAFKRTLIASLQDDTPQLPSGGAPSGNSGSLWGEVKTAQGEGDRLVQEILASAQPAQLPQRPSLLHNKSGTSQFQRPYQNGTHHPQGASANTARSQSDATAPLDRAAGPAGSHSALSNPLNSAHLMHDKPPPSQLPAAQLANTNSQNPGEASLSTVRNGATDNSKAAAVGPTAPMSMPTEGTGHPRVDGKDFFRQARTRLAYESFAAFLQNIKDLNTGRQSREQTLERARSIFGDTNTDLYHSFQALLARHLSN